MNLYTLRYDWFSLSSFVSGEMEPDWYKYDAQIKHFLRSKSLEFLTIHYNSVYNSKETKYYSLRNLGTSISFFGTTLSNRWPREAILEILYRAIQEKKGAPESIWYDN